MIERIKLIMKANQLSAADLADRLGTERSGISHFLSGRNKPSLAFITKLLEKFPELSPDWLLLGQGSMIRNEQNSKSLTETTNANFNSNKQITEAPLSNSYLEESVVKNEEPANYGKSEKTFTTESLNTINADKEIIKNDNTIDRIIIFYNDKTFVEYKARKSD